MTTNILQLLHTTAAYQGAVVQLMVHEANFTAKQLDLKETVPAIVATDTNRWEVDPPPEGIGGAVQSENYLFWFHQGKLGWVQKQRWFEKLSPPVMDVRDLADRPSLLDTNSAYALAKKQLASLSVDVAALEKKYPPTVFQLRARKRGPESSLTGIRGDIEDVPLFMIGWGEDPMNPILQERLRELNRPRPHRPPSEQSPVFMEFLGTTRELIDLRINDPSVLTRPALQLTNAEALLGPTPPPQHFVEDVVGGKEAYRTIAEPEKVEVWLLSPQSADGDRLENKDRAGPVRLKPEDARKFSEPLLAFDSYLWNVGKGCLPDYGARLRFTRGSDVVDIRLCYQCDILEITHAGKDRMLDFDPMHNTLVRALQGIFPEDRVVQDLKAR